MDTVLGGCQGTLLPDDGAKVSGILWLSVRSIRQTEKSRSRDRKHEARAMLFLILYHLLKNYQFLGVFTHGKEPCLS